MQGGFIFLEGTGRRDGPLVAGSSGLIERPCSSVPPKSFLHKSI